MKRNRALGIPVIAAAVLALVLAWWPSAGQAGEGCQVMYFQPYGGQAYPFSGCYGFRAPPAGDVWYVDTDAERGNTIDRGDVLQLFAGKPPASAAARP